MKKGKVRGGEKMKRIYRASLVLLMSAAALTGCGEETEGVKETSSSESSQAISSESVESSEDSSSAEESTEAVYTIEDFFPNTDNKLYEYTGEGNEYAGFSEYTVYSNENRKQYLRNNTGTTVAEVVALQEDQIVVLYHEGETYYRENLLEKSDESIEVLLQGPFEVGTSWEAPDNRTKTITGLEVPVTTELEEYETLEVTTKWKDSETTNIDYYAPGIGLVKSVYTDQGMEVLTEINAITEKTVEQSIRFYYPNGEAGEVAYIDKTVQMNTNDETKRAIEAVYKEVPDGLVPVLSENVEINSLYLNDDGRVYVDFSEELLTEMNAGSSIEMMILESLVNTIGTYYNVDEVYLTVEDQPYQSGHIEMQEGEYFQVNLEEVPEF